VVMAVIGVYAGRNLHVGRPVPSWNGAVRLA